MRIRHGYCQALGLCLAVLFLMCKPAFGEIVALGGGWQADIPDGATTTITLEGVWKDLLSIWLIETDFVNGPGSTGVLEPSEIVFEQVLPDENTVLVQRELDKPFIVLSNFPAHACRGSWFSSLPITGVLGLGSGTTGGRPFRPVASTSPSTG